MRNLLTGCLLVLLATLRIASGQAVLEPPFGLQWGDSPEKLIDWAARHTLDVDISLPGDQPALRIVRISARKGALPSTRATAVEGRFHTGRLFEVTVHYAAGDESADQVETRFNTLKRELTNQYGELIANRQDRAVQDQFATRRLAYHREPVKGLFLLLAYTEIEDLLRKKREATFSLLYRNDNLRQQLEQQTAPGAPATGTKDR